MTFVAAFVSIVADVLPLVGDGKVVETVRGEDILGEELDVFERGLGGAILLVQLRDAYVYIKGKAKKLSPLFTRFDALARLFYKWTQFDVMRAVNKAMAISTTRNMAKLAGESGVSEIRSTRCSSRLRSSRPFPDDRATRGHQSARLQP